MAVKRRLETILQMIAPIRERRTAYARDPAYILDLLRTGNGKARAVTQATLARRMNRWVGKVAEGGEPKFDATALNSRFVDRAVLRIL